MCAGSFDVLAEVVCEDDDRLLHLLNDSDPLDPRRAVDRDLPLPEAGQADLHLGDPMSDMAPVSGTVDDNS